MSSKLATCEFRFDRALKQIATMRTLHHANMRPHPVRRPVHDSIIDVQKMGTLLTSGKLLKRKLTGFEYHIRSSLRGYGCSLEPVSVVPTKLASAS